MPDTLPFHDPHLPEILEALFGHMDPTHWIESRVLAETGTGGTHRSQHWFASPAALLAALPDLEVEATPARAGIYIGVLPRTRKGGTAADAGPGAVAWADLDWKLDSAGESAIRKRLADFPLQPTIIVASGHGLHAYWALKEPEPPAICVELSKRLEVALHGDHVADAARILRLPGTWNHKDAPPTRSRVEVCDLRRAINPDDLRAITPAPPVARAAAPASAPADPGAPKRARKRETAAAPAALPAEITAMIQGSEKLAALFAGRGKPELDSEGKPTDRSSSGYDWSLLMALTAPPARSRYAAIRDPAILQAILAARPDGRARTKGAAYLERTVAAALAVARPEPIAKPLAPDAVPDDVRRAPKDEAGGRRNNAKASAGPVDFTVDHVRIYDSDPPVYVFTIGGRPLRLSSAELQIPGAFGRRYLDALHRLPQLPDGRGGAGAWRALVNGWLATAEVIHQPVDASREHTVREAVGEFLDRLMCGTDIADLDRDRGLTLEDGRVLFKLRVATKWMAREFRELGTHTLAATLRDMGIEEARVRVGGVQVRGWVVTKKPPAPDETATATPPSANGIAP